MKEKLHSYCMNYVNDRSNQLHRSLQELKISLEQETKSSAGDKHETGRAMIQLEQEKLGKQLGEVEQLHEILSKASQVKTKDRVVLGSLVQTTSGTYYLTISAGKIVVSNQEYIAIALDTPIGKLLLGKKPGGTFSFLGATHTIIAIQ